jgi:hypothetical protein
MQIISIRKTIHLSTLIALSLDSHIFYRSFSSCCNHFEFIRITYEKKNKLIIFASIGEKLKTQTKINSNKKF